MTCSIALHDRLDDRLRVAHIQIIGQNVFQIFFWLKSNVLWCYTFMHLYETKIYLDLRFVLDIFANWL